MPFVGRGRNQSSSTPPAVDKIITKYPFYTRGFIPTELYHVPGKILSFGPTATLVTSASSDPRVVAAIAEAIMTHIADLKTMYPVLPILMRSGWLHKP